jgi:hypothetical protein
LAKHSPQPKKEVDPVQESRRFGFLLTSRFRSIIIPRTTTTINTDTKKTLEEKTLQIAKDRHLVPRIDTTIELFSVQHNTYSFFAKMFFKNGGIVYGPEDYSKWAEVFQATQMTITFSTTDRGPGGGCVIITVFNAKVPQ